jgi:hypothetical protein
VTTVCWGGRVLRRAAHARAHSAAGSTGLACCHMPHLFICHTSGCRLPAALQRASCQLRALRFCVRGVSVRALRSQEVARSACAAARSCLLRPPRPALRRAPAASVFLVYISEATFLKCRRCADDARAAPPRFPRRSSASPRACGRACRRAPRRGRWPPPFATAAGLRRRAPFPMLCFAHTLGLVAVRERASCCCVPRHAVRRRVAPPATRRLLAPPRHVPLCRAAVRAVASAPSADATPCRPSYLAAAAASGWGQGNRGARTWRSG